ncbi:unnamed protein product [Anisakis simplex]|uniref:Ovule protein n=1 Tax=Anisakis simplex TaxID=6269 RepID=A0A0M3JFV4_ANISI|nr:unnamed protein product [Anisakis simplex]
MHYGKLKISPTSDGMVTEDTARKLHLNLNMNVNLNDVYPSVFKIKTPSTWRKESVYSDGKEPSYMVMSHFARTTKLAHIASKVSHFQSFEVSSARSDETLQAENEVGDESNETWKDNNTRVGNKLDEKRSQFDGYYGSLLISSFTKMPLV